MREYSQSWMLLPISLTIAFFTSIASAQSNITYDDTNFSMQYSTSPAWNTDVWAQQSPPPYNGTNHGSPNPGAQMTFTFTGNAIYIYGYKWTDHGFRTFLIDDTREIQCDGRTGEQGSRALLFYRTSMSDADHTLTIKNTGTQGQYLNLDYVVITQGFVRPFLPFLFPLSHLIIQPHSATHPQREPIKQHPNRRNHWQIDP
ncbi:hypothetical protein BDN72DRAFT_837450 [Pluteus cervinus]|uniref:Uncharacterized protein n=1 Tax=Pluteus cervinus TaxID=181527 RepID=A0ACD3B0N2_9AGAR|nr:hypothetical protein BDN72DRAFT_837450 [Pluteus cervinus]